MTLPIAEHGDVVTCTNGHRVGVAERFEKRLGIAEDFAVILDDLNASARECQICGKPWWRPRRPTAELHVEGRGWVRTSDEGGAA